MTIKTSSDGAAAVDHDYPWRPIETCPVGRKVQLVNKKMGCADGLFMLRMAEDWVLGKAE